MDLREVGYDDRDWINLAQNRDRWRAYCPCVSLIRCREASLLQLVAQKEPRAQREKGVLQGTARGLAITEKGSSYKSGGDVRFKQNNNPYGGGYEACTRWTDWSFVEIIPKTNMGTNGILREELTGSRQIHVEAECSHLFRILRIPSVSLHNFEGHQDCGNCAMLGRGDRMELSELFA
ncbi:hypothetical protein ANN_24950 [Periplaneta americana]|uniref:Uncharacterized protein n=1 Tax=Periplaneta americana TaxID=6978 RepID=A0ABQ8S0C4_PERAM|nr:hypothetical protein ANN_24950 [Periplaneta americana]